MVSTAKKIGLVINPIAGMGGAVGLKGTDGKDTLEKALSLGASPRAPERAREALDMFFSCGTEAFFYTCPQDMGENVLKEYTKEYELVFPHFKEKASSRQDTLRAAKRMEELGVELILFAGGDGTARDICEAVGLRVPVLGIPAGVKIHSAVFAVTPKKAGELAARFLDGKVRNLKESEVMDIDEEAYRKGEVKARLFGYLLVPWERSKVQCRKSGSMMTERVVQQAIAEEVVSTMDEGVLYLLGPGTTVKAIADRLGIEKSLLGVDAVLDGMSVGRDLAEKEILKLLDEYPKVKTVVSPIGGQGYILGRGNLQLSPRVIRNVGKENIIIVATPQKIASLHGAPLLVDTGDSSLDMALVGVYPVITGYREKIFYRVEA